MKKAPHSFRATFTKGKKDLYYLIVPGFKDSVYLEHAYKLFTGVSIFMSDVDQRILAKAKEMKMFPLTSGDRIIITDHESTREYKLNLFGWSLVKTTKGTLNIPELQDV